MPVEPQAPYISSKEAAKKYGLTNDHIGLLCRRGKIQGLLWGRVWFVSEPSLKGYIQKNLELKEARRAALSKQWRGAWTVAFIAFFLFAASGDYASADFVSMPARVVAKVEASPLSLTALVAKVGELKELVPAPQIPELPKPVVNQVNTSNNSFISNVHEGLAAVGESISNIFAVEPEAAPAYKMRVTYAKDIEPQLTAQEPISLFLTAAVINAGAVAATLPAPQLTYEAPHVEPLLTAENLLAGMMLANETLSRLNDNMFALYLESFNSFAEVVAFDASAGAHVWEKTFGAFGERFVSDLAQLNDLQVSFYFAAADELDEAYNSFADSVEGSHMFDSSISVASVSLAPSMTIPGEKQVAAVWDGWIDLLVYTFFTQKTTGIESPPQAEVSNNAPVSSKPAQPAFALDPKVLPVAPSKPSTNPTSVVTPAPVSYFSSAGLVTQEELNAQFSIWMQAVRALIEGNGNQTGYADNPASAAIGAGGGVVNNFYSISQRIDRLDDVTITNSSINGVSDFSNIGATDGIGTWFTPSSIGNSTSTLLHFTAGFISLASSTVTNLSTINSTSTNATTTNFAITGLSSQAGNCLTVTSSGSVTAQTCGSGSGTFSFTPITNFGATANSTSTPVWFTAGLQASSTSHFVNADFTNSTSTNATTTNLAVTGITSSLLKTLSSGAVVAAVAGTDYATTDTVGSWFVPGAFGATASNATSTLIGFTAGLYATASSTIGGGTQTTGLTILGGATTTGSAYFNGNIGIGTTTPGTLLSLGNTGANTVNISATATSTFGSGINIKSGCFAVNDVCLPSVDQVVTLSSTFATSTPGSNVDVVFTGAVDSAASFSAASGGILTLPSNTSHYIIELVGGGEGGSDGATSNTGSGGTGGGYAKEIVYDTTSSYYTVGARGAASGGAGGTSCFGTNSTACTSPLVSATGGSNSPGRGFGGIVNVAGSSNDSRNGGRSFYGAGATSTATFVEMGGGGYGGDSGNGNGYAGGAGGLIIYVYTLSNAGADLAELYPVKDHNLTSGEIVTFSSALPITVGRAQRGHIIAGVVSTDPGIVLGNTKDPTGQRPIALAGRVPTKVNLEGGSIAIGDRIALSSVPGVGKRATLFEDSIGIAIENFDGTTGDSVMVFLDLQQGIDIGTISEGLLVGVSSNTTTPTTATSEVASSTSIFNFGTRFLESLAAQLVQWFASASNGILAFFAKEVHTEKLCVGNTCVSEEQFLAMVAASGQQSSSAPQAPTPEPEENASSTSPVAGQAPEVPAPDETTSSTSTISEPEVEDGHATSTPEVVLNDTAILESLSSAEE